MESALPASSLQAQSDPLFGLRSEGSTIRFSESGDVAHSTMPTVPPTPSTTSMRKIAKEAGFSVEDIDAATEVLCDPILSSKVMPSTTPKSMDHPTTMARKIVSSMFKGRQQEGKLWRGPLPAPRVSPPTLCACPTLDHRDGTRRRRPEVDEGIRILNQDPRSLGVPIMGHHGLNTEMSIWTRAGWTRFQ